MILRIWRTEVQTGRATDYEHFAMTRSLPMFRRQSGCRGVLLAEHSGERIAITLWEDQEAVARLEESADYLQTVRALLDSGILQGDQATRVYGAAAGFLDPQMPLIGSPTSQLLRPEDDSVQ